MQGTCDEEIKVFKLIIFSCFISDTSVLIYSFRLIKNFSSFNTNNIHELIFFIELGRVVGSFFVLFDISLDFIPW